MAKLAAKPVIFKAPISVGSDEYTAHLSRAEFVPSQPTASFTDLDGVTTNLVGDSAWVLELAGLQDYETLNGLSDYLFDHDGEHITVSFEFGGYAWSATVIAAAVNVGGNINQPALFTKQLQVNGKPSKTPLT